MPDMITNELVIALSLATVLTNETLRFIRNRKTVKIGDRRFRVIDDHSVYRYYFPNAGQVLVSFTIPLFLTASAALSDHAGMDFLSVTWLMPCFALTVIYLSLFTRLFKVKAVIDRKEKTVSSSLLFNLRKISEPASSIAVETVNEHGDRMLPYEDKTRQIVCYREGKNGIRKRHCFFAVNVTETVFFRDFYEYLYQRRDRKRNSGNPDSQAGEKL